MCHKGYLYVNGEGISFLLKYCKKIMGTWNESMLQVEKEYISS